MSPCDYINLGYHGLLITMVTFSKFITSQSLPMIFSLLPDKKKESYLKLANILLDKCGDLKEVIILLD